MDVDLISDQIALRTSEDPAKIDLEMHCRCGEWLCDIEAGDSLSVLLRTAEEHLRHCPEAVA